MGAGRDGLAARLARWRERGRSRRAIPGGRSDPMAAVEVAAVVILVLLHEWVPWRFWGVQPWPKWVDRHVFLILAAAVVVFSFLRLGETREELGLVPMGSGSRWRGGWGSVAVFTAISLGGLVLARCVWGPDASGSAGAARLSWVAAYVPGLIGQQLALQCFLNNRAYYAAAGPEPRRRARAVIAGSIVFVLLHAPNPALMAGVTWTGWFWCRHFRIHRNLPALMVSHLLLGIAAMAMLGDGLMLRLRVGRPALKILFGWT